MIIHISLKKDRSRCYAKSLTEEVQPIPHQLRRMHFSQYLINWEGCNFSQYLISYVGVTGRWGLLSHAQHAVGGWPPYPCNRWKFLKHCISLRSCPSKIVATIQTIVIIMCCRCTHTHTRHSTFLVWFQVWYEVNNRKSKIKVCLGFSFYFSLISWYIPARQESA